MMGSWQGSDVFMVTAVASLSLDVAQLNVSPLKSRQVAICHIGERYVQRYS